MKTRSLTLLLAASASFCQAALPDLLSVLQNDPATQAFAELLTDFPDMIASLSNSTKYTVFVPSNAAVADFREVINGNGTALASSHRLKRRGLTDSAAALAMLFTDNSNQANINTDPTNLVTNLTDPAFVNLGPASVSASVTQSSTRSTSSSSLSTPSSVQSTSSSIQSTSIKVSLTSSSAQSSSAPASSTQSSTLETQTPTASTSSSSTTVNGNVVSLPTNPGASKKRSSLSYSTLHHRQPLNGSALLISSGFGDISQASMSETAFSGGSIRTVDNFFTLYGDLPSTLQQTNGTGFSSALSKAGTLNSLTNTPRITIFVPTDATLQGRTLDANALKRYVLLNTYATTPSLKAGLYQTSAGDSLNVTTLSDGSFVVDGAKITKGNVMIKNGVIHYIDSILPLSFTGSAPTIKATVLPVFAIGIAIVISCMGMGGF